MNSHGLLLMYTYIVILKMSFPWIILMFHSYDSSALNQTVTASVKSKNENDITDISE